jgi:chorismate synthase
MSSTFGKLFRVSTFGESHCKSVGVVIDGVPPGMRLCEGDIQPQLDRRRPGQSKLTTPRNEADRAMIQSGTEGGVTLGTPVAVIVANRDQRPGDYGEMAVVPRPSHADYTYLKKYGIKSSSGGGRASARETIGRVIAGAVAEKYLREKFGVEIVAWVNSVGRVESQPVDINTITREMVDATAVRCPDVTAAGLMEEHIKGVMADSDSTGGTICCVCRGIPIGWGEPVFDKLEAMLAHAMLSLPATKGFEFGSGFAGTALRGSEHNDPFIVRGSQLGTATNNSGGIQGGISNGEPIYFKVGFKPTATIGLPQDTVDLDGSRVVLKAKGRHDPCVVPRAVPIVEAMAALVLADAALQQAARQSAMA